MAIPRSALVVLFLIVVVDLLGFGAVLPLLARYGNRLDADWLVVGLLMSSFSAMQFLASPWWGKCSDRIGRRPVLLVGLLGSVIFYGLFGYASAIESLTLLFVARLGAGLACATIPTAQAYIADVTTPENRTTGMAIIGAAFGVGFTFGPLLGVAALTFETEGDARLSALPGYLAAGLSVVALVMAWFSLPESLASAPSPSEAPSPSRGVAALLRPQAAFHLPDVAALVTIFFFTSLAFATFESTLSLLSELTFTLPDKVNLILFFIMGLTLAFAQGFLVRRLAKTVPDQRLATLGIILMLLGLVGVVAANEWRSLPVLVVVLMVLVVGFAFATPSLQSLLSRAAPADRQGEILGLNQAGASLARIFGQTFGVWLLGQQINRPFWIGAGLMLISLYLLTRWRQREGQLPMASVTSPVVGA